MPSKDAWSHLERLIVDRLARGCCTAGDSCQDVMGEIKKADLSGPAEISRQRSGGLPSSVLG
jgi:hypothetical protein